MDSSINARVIRVILPFAAKWAGLATIIGSLHALWTHCLEGAGLHCEVAVTFRRGFKPLWMIARNRAAPDFDFFKRVKIWSVGKGWRRHAVFVGNVCGPT